MFGTTEPVGWVHYADNSYVATRLLWITGLPLESAVYGHRTIELYIKAFLVGQGVEVRPGSRAWGHELGALGEAATRYDSAFGKEAVARRLRFFERYFNYVRYPGDVVAPSDGSLTWFAFDANITPLDELVAFVRPRIRLDDEDWRRSVIHTLIGSDAKNGYQRRALTDRNAQLDIINCLSTGHPDVPFNVSFRYDRPGC